MHVTRSKKSAASLAAAVAALGLGLVGPATPVAAGLAAAPAAGGGCLSAPANARQMGGGDGTDPNSVSLAETKAMEAEFQAGVQSLPKRAAGRGIRHASYKGIHLPKNIKIDTYVHVITRADGTGGVTDKMIRDQIKVMNDGYAGKTSRDAAATPFSFKLKAVDRTANDDWYDWSDPDVDPSRRHRGQDGVAPGHLPGPEHLHRRARRQPARLRLLPERRPAVAGRPGAAQRQPAGRCGRAVQRGRHGDPRGRALVVPAPHVRERLHIPGRRGSGHRVPGRRRQHLRVRRVPGHLRPARERTRSTTS